MAEDTPLVDCKSHDPAFANVFSPSVAIFKKNNDPGNEAAYFVQIFTFWHHFRIILFVLIITSHFWWAFLIRKSKMADPRWRLFRNNDIIPALDDGI